MVLTDTTVDPTVSLNEWGRVVNEWAQTKGWRKPGESPEVVPDDTGAPYLAPNAVDKLAKELLNIVSEVVEAWEELRNNRLPNEVYTVNGKPEGVAIELADAVIRILDTCHVCGIDLDAAIKLKMDYNATRPYRHGGKAA